MTGSQILEFHCSLSFRLPTVCPSIVGGMFVFHRILHGSAFLVSSDPENAEFMKASLVQSQVWVKGASRHTGCHSITACSINGHPQSHVVCLPSSILQSLFVPKVLT